MNSKTQSEKKIPTIPEKPKLGRPGAITPEIEELLIIDLLKGYPISIVLSLHGIDDSIYERALKVKSFRDRVRRAQSIALKPALDKVIESAGTSVDSARWLLERRAAGDFKASTSQGAETRNITVKIKGYDDRGREKK
jgi:hypothetical protein